MSDLTPLKLWVLRVHLSNQNLSARPGAGSGEGLGTAVAVRLPTP